LSDIIIIIIIIIISWDYCELCCRLLWWKLFHSGGTRSKAGELSVVRLFQFFDHEMAFWWILGQKMEGPK